MDTILHFFSSVTQYQNNTLKEIDSLLNLQYKDLNRVSQNLKTLESTFESYCEQSDKGNAEIIHHQMIGIEKERETINTMIANYREQRKYVDSQKRYEGYMRITNRISRMSKTDPEKVLANVNKMKTMSTEQNRLDENVRHITLNRNIYSEKTITTTFDERWSQTVKKTRSDPTVIGLKSQYPDQRVGIKQIKIAINKGLCSQEDTLAESIHEPQPSSSIPSPPNGFKTKRRSRNEETPVKA